MMTNDKIMVTGAKGLLGSALVSLLEAQGYQNIVAIGHQDCDLTNQAQTLGFIQDHNPDYVFHLAARVYGLMGNLSNQALSFYDNILINTNVVHGAYLAGVKKITVMGTGCVYPYPSPSLPLQEDMIFEGRPHQSGSGYAHAKRAMLAMCEAYEQSHDMAWAYIVSCNIFGTHDKFDIINGRFVPSIIKKCYDAKQLGERVTVWGNGSAQRDFLYAKDAAKATLAIMDHLNGPVNMGSGTVYAIREVIGMLTDITGLHNAFDWDPSKPNGQDYRGYDLSKLQSIGFTSSYSMAEGLQETWDWYCNQQTQ